MPQAGDGRELVRRARTSDATMKPMSRIALLALLVLLAAPACSSSQKSSVVTGYIVSTDQLRAVLPLQVSTQLHAFMPTAIGEWCRPPKQVTAGPGPGILGGRSPYHDEHVNRTENSG
jgi:hypothetical protein